MDWNRVEGNWKQIKGTVKQKWGNLTDDDLTAINGKREQLEGKIQERYGIAKDQAAKTSTPGTTRKSGKAWSIPASVRRGGLSPGNFMAPPPACAGLFHTSSIGAYVQTGGIFAFINASRAGARGVRGWIWRSRSEDVCLWGFLDIRTRRGRCLFLPLQHDNHPDATNHADEPRNNTGLSQSPHCRLLPLTLQTVDHPAFF
jgi:uncharacterized protein YjbJ (UPF0337 family)